MVGTERGRRAVARHPESGAVIILALAFLVVIGILTLALFGMAFTGSGSLRSFRLERVRRYNADAALQSAVQMAKGDPTVGVSTTPPTCAMTFAMQDTPPSGVTNVLTAGSTLYVSCVATPGTTSGTPDTDGGQSGRDVTFTVTCNRPSAAGGTDKLSCQAPGAGTTAVVLGRARVRYDPDYSLPAVTPNCNVGCTASTVRAVVPKVVTWTIQP